MIMVEYGRILGIVMIIFLFLVLIEKLYGYLKGKDTAPNMDTIASISAGMLFSVKAVLNISVTLLTYDWLYGKVALFNMEATILAFAIAFITIDFYGYWTHRIAHQVNFFWNHHVIHHSSEEFNLACALRQPVSLFVKFFTFILFPAALIGVPPVIMALAIPIQFYSQFWYHTQHIKKMGFLENILVTPSHHRVHHAINPEYMDKNHSQIFIIWDKLFGTFQEELDNVTAVYGVTRPAQSWNPIRINFQHISLLISDAWRAENWKDRFTIWFKPTGWRPENFNIKYPVNKISNVYDFQKYGTSHTKNLMYWAIIQMLFTLVTILYMFNNIAIIGLPNVFIYGAFIFISVSSYTELMDTRKISVLWESLRFLFGIGIILFLGDWFGLNQIYFAANYIIIAYLVLSLLITLYFVSTNFEGGKIKIQ
jgi:sterol desaturase/sphingolipid hydroxylase (fatty acid hydroxylase superfamily)